MKRLKTWLVPLVITVSLFVMVRSTFAQAVEGLAGYLASNNVQVGSESVNGFQQVFYTYQREKKFITEGGFNSTTPASTGEYITYRKNTGYGTDNIFLYNILTGDTVQVTNSGNSGNPKVNRDGKVVWEGWVSGGWQIFLFDGVTIKQLTENGISVNPDIEGNKIVYATRDVGEWKGVYYSLDDNKAYDISFGENTVYPHLKDGRIYFGTTRELGELFALTTEDLELLNFESVSSATEEATQVATASGTPAEPTPVEPTPMTEEAVREEIEATPSSTIQPTITETPPSD